MNYWDTTNVTDMTDMFTGCDNLERAILGYGWTFDGDGSLDDSEKSILPPHRLAQHLCRRLGGNRIHPLAARIQPLGY